MKAKEGVLEQLNGILRAELTAVHQYLLHAAMTGHWGTNGSNMNFASWRWRKWSIVPS